jgi:metal-responsive CopG/Arc/MetJ family transcriptional regulator
MMVKTKHQKYGERKTDVTVSLTPSVIKGLDERAQKNGLSRSEYIEGLARGTISAEERRMLGEFLAS